MACDVSPAAMFNLANLKDLLETLFIYSWGLYYILHEILSSSNVYHTKKGTFCHDFVCTEGNDIG